MAYLQSTGSQVLLCLRCFGFGFLIGMAYELVRFVRLSVGTRRCTALWDVCFGAAAAVAAFLFDLFYGDGRLRVFVLAAKCAGFWVWYTFVSPAMRRRERRVTDGIRRFCATVRAPFDRIGRRIADWMLKQQKKIKIIEKNHQKKQKNSCNSHP